MVNRHYEKRMMEHKRRKAKVRAANNERARQDRLFQVEGMLEEYEAAYKLANAGRECHLVYQSGWVRMAESPTFRVRVKVLGALAKELRDIADCV